MQTVDLRLDAEWILPVEPEGALGGHALDGGEGRPAALVEVALLHGAGAGRGGHGPLAAILAGEEAGRQGRVGDHAEAYGLAHRRQLGLELGPVD